MAVMLRIALAGWWLASLACAAEGWDRVAAIPRDTVTRVRTAAGEARGVFLSATSDGMLLRTNSGEQSLARAEIREVRIRSSARRTRNGIIGTAIGAGAGIGIGVAVCPGCSGEGKPYKFVGPLLAIGAAIGAAAGFVPPAYQMVYRAPKR